MHDRILELSRGQTAFLRDACKTGKSTQLRRQFPDSAGSISSTPGCLRNSRAPWAELVRHPALRASPVILDEMQKVPSALDEVRRLDRWPELRTSRFDRQEADARPCESSRRTRLAFPASSRGMAGNSGIRFPQGAEPGLDSAAYGELSAVACCYMDDYLKEEVFDEGLTRNIAAFSRSFGALGFCEGEILNHVARDCGADDGARVLPDSRRTSGALQPLAVTRCRAAKLFDVNAAGHLTGRRIVSAAGSEALSSASCRWSSTVHTGFSPCATGAPSPVSNAISFSNGTGKPSVKGSARLGPSALRAMQACVDEHSPRTTVVVCNESAPRRTRNGNLVRERFLERLRADALVE